LEEFADKYLARLRPIAVPQAVQRRHVFDRLDLGKKISLDQILVLLAFSGSTSVSLSFPLSSRFISIAHLSLEISLQPSESNYSLKTIRSICQLI